MRLQANYAQAIYNYGLTLNRSGPVPVKRWGMPRRACAWIRKTGEALALMVSLLQQTCDWSSLDKAGERLDGLTDQQLEAGQRTSESPFLSFTAQYRCPAQSDGQPVVEPPPGAKPSAVSCPFFFFRRPQPRQTFENRLSFRKISQCGHGTPDGRNIRPA